MWKFLYLLIDLGAISIPLIFSFHQKLRFNKTWKAFWPATLIVAAVFIAWDVAFTKIGVWGFDPKYLIGIDLFGLPIEEWLFFICIPYACVFTYHAIKTKIKGDPMAKAVPLLNVLLIVVLAGMATVNIERLYTATTFIALALVLFVFHFVIEPKWLGTFYLSFIVILVPFFIVNGLLTGAGIDGEVVWYNDAENLGIRMGTIPVEDTFYAMLLLILNVWTYEILLGPKLSSADGPAHRSS